MAPRFRHSIRLTALAVAAAGIAVGAAAQPAPGPPSGIRLDLPFLDAPYNVNHGGRAPSWHQSLALSVDFYEASHTGLERAFSSRKWSRLSILVVDLFASYILPMPGTVGWLHEESHRAIMGRRGIDSFNDVYNFALARPALYVSHVADDDLIRLKRDHPEEHVRMSAAGLEGEYRLVQRLESNAFFGKSRAWHLPIYLATKISSLGYVWSGHLDIVNRETDTLNDIDGPDPSVRDFTGHDVLAWAYDLHRPDEPYAARGVHPSGVGIDRYIKPSDLTATELAYLKRQGLLQLVNFIDPFLFGSSGFRLTNPFNHRPMRITARGGHLLTPFGYTLDADVMFEQERMRLFVVVHTYVSQQRTLPGIDVTWLDIPMGGAILVSPRAAVWWQPEGQRFAATRARSGGLLGVRIDLRREPRLGGYAEVEAKTAGWVAGTEYLDSNVSVRLGLTLRIW